MERETKKSLQDRYKAVANSEEIKNAVVDDFKSNTNTAILKEYLAQEDSAAQA